MSEHVASEIRVDVCRGEVIWPKSLEEPRSDEQQRSLRRLVRDSRDGVILDCSGVEAFNSEIVNLLMRVRNHAKKLNKDLVLFNVPESLSKLILLCHLGSILPIAGDATAARKLVSDRARSA